MSRNRVRWPVFVLLALVPCGCQGGRKPVAPVTGRVLDARGVPAVGALLIFHPEEGSAKETLKPVGRTDSEGRFRLTTYTEGDGAPAGRYRVTLTWAPPRRTPFEPESGDLLKGRFASVDKPITTVSVEAGKTNEVPEIRLEVSGP